MATQIPQGTLNRLKASMTLNSFPGLNITPEYLGKEMITLTPTGDITSFIPTTTGAVTSPEPYQFYTISAHLLKTQALAPAYKSQLESNSLLGDITVWLDVQTGQGVASYSFNNCAIKGVGAIKIDGMDAGWMVEIGGYYTVNASLFD